MASQILVARHLNPYLMGISAIAFSISDFVNLMQAFGLRNFLIREGELDDSVIASTFTINLIMSLCTSALVIGLAFGGASLFHEARVGEVLLIVALLPLVMSFELVPGGLLQRNMAFGSLAIANSAKAIVTSTISITMVYLGASYMSISYGALAGALVSAGLTCLLGRRYMYWRLNLSHWRRITQFGVHMLSVGGVANIAVRSVDLIVGRMLGLASLGLFSRASALNNVLWTNIHLVFTKVVFSGMADEMRTNGSIRAIYLKTVNMVTAILWPAFAGLAVLSGPVVFTMYGPKWVGAAPILSIFSIAAMGLAATTMAWEVFVVCERTGEQARIETVRGVLTLVSAFIGVTFGVLGAAAGRVADAGFTYALYRKRMNELTETRHGEILVIYMRNIGLTAAAILPSVVVMHLHHWDPHTPLLQVFAVTVAGITLWAATAQILNKHLAEEMAAIFRKMCKLFGINWQLHGMR
jgi:O-antigen/teichoic acid export membrane protein